MIRTFYDTVAEHKAADASAGRVWTCACASCRTARNPECPGCGETRKNLFGDCANLACRTRQADLKREFLNMTREERAEAAACEKADMDMSEPLFVAPNGRRSASVAFEIVRRAKAGVR